MKPCQIPFIFKNETFYGCTTILGKSETGVYRFGNPWCSTKTTVKHEHISNGGFYGDCLEENCPSAGEADDFLDSLFDTGKSLSEALLFAEHGENMLCTKIVLNVRNNFCTQHVLPRFELGTFMF